ncbi:hypothetical protein LguiA_032709 [Lonicera macranthoides]
MGMFPCPLPFKSSQEFDSHHSTPVLQSESSESSLSSIPSLASLPQPPTRHRCITTLNSHSPVFSLTLAGKHLFTGSSTAQILIWSRDPSSPPNNYTVASTKSAIKSLQVLGNRLFSAHHDHKIRVWKIDGETDTKFKLLATLPTLNDRITRVLFAKNYIKVRRQKKRTWVHHADTISALALNNDGSLLYSVSWDRTFKVWRTSDFKCLESVWNAHDDAINAVVLSKDGFVYTGSADKKIKVWKIQTGDKKHRLVNTLEKHKSTVNALALSSDGSVLYSGAYDRSIIVWEKSGGGDMVVVGALRGHKKSILCLVLVGDLVCSGSADKTIRIWWRGIENSYPCLAVFEGHTGPVKCLAAAVDNTDSGSGNSYLVYSGSLDYDVKGGGDQTEEEVQYRVKAVLSREEDSVVRDQNMATTTGDLRKGEAGSVPNGYGSGFVESKLEGDVERKKTTYCSNSDDNKRRSQEFHSSEVKLIRLESTF